MSNDLFATIVEIIKEQFSKLLERFGQSVKIYDIQIKRDDNGVEIDTEFGNFLSNLSHKHVIKTVDNETLMQHYSNGSIDAIVKEMISTSIVPKYQF